MEVETDNTQRDTSPDPEPGGIYPSLELAFKSREIKGRNKEERFVAPPPKPPRASPTENVPPRPPPPVGWNVVGFLLTIWGCYKWKDSQ